MGVDGRVLRISPESFRRLITAEPDIGEIIMRTFILRRTAFISHAQGGVTLSDQKQALMAFVWNIFFVEMAIPLLLCVSGIMSATRLCCAMA
jgi:thioredoxin reductase (NADPH)